VPRGPCRATSVRAAPKAEWPSRLHESLRDDLDGPQVRGYGPAPKYEVLESFRADHRRLSPTEKALFWKALPDFIAACDRYALDPSTGWPRSLRVKDVEGARGILEMTWNFAGPDGRATFEWVTIDGERGVGWRRLGGHAIFRDP